MMLLDGERPARELQNFRVGQHGRFAFLAGGPDVARARASRLAIDEFFLLGANRFLDDRSAPLVRQQLFEDHIFVRVHGALDDVFAKSPGRIDDDHAGEAGFGVEREHHAGPRTIGADHFLDADGQRDLQMIEAVGLAVDDGAIGEQGRVAFAARPQQLGFPADVEIAFLLSREAGLGQVLRGGAAAHGDRGIRRPTALCNSR